MREGIMHWIEWSLHAPSDADLIFSCAGSFKTLITAPLRRLTANPVFRPQLNPETVGCF